MKVETIDLEDFFDDKYRYLRNNGIGATGIITESQMVTRVNSDDSHGEEFRGVGYHEETKIAIIRDIFGFDDVLDNGIGYYDRDMVEFDMSREFKEMLKEVVEIKYFNNDYGNVIVIYLPKKNMSLTSSQLEAIEYLGQKIEEVSSNLSQDITVYAIAGEKNAEEINGVSETIVPFLSHYIDNTLEQSIKDKYILAKEDVTSLTYT